MAEKNDKQSETKVEGLKKSFPAWIIAALLCLIVLFLMLRIIGVHYRLVLAPPGLSDLYEDTFKLSPKEDVKDVVKKVEEEPKKFPTGEIETPKPPPEADKVPPPEKQAQAPQVAPPPPEEEEQPDLPPCDVKREIRLLLVTRDIQSRTRLIKDIQNKLADPSCNPCLTKAEFIRTCYEAFRSPYHWPRNATLLQMESTMIENGVFPKNLGSLSLDGCIFHAEYGLAIDDLNTFVADVDNTEVHDRVSLDRINTIYENPLSPSTPGGGRGDAGDDAGGGDDAGDDEGETFFFPIGPRT